MATARANLETTISADMSQYAATMRRAGMVAQQTGAKIGKSFGEGLKRQIAGAGAALAAAFGARAFARGIKGAADLGGALSDLSARTGIAAGNLAVLGRAFEDNGVSADKIGGVINKLQKAIYDFGQGSEKATKPFKTLGISFSDISKLSPDKQFALIQQKIAGIQDPAERAAIAMQIFGKSGGELLTLFADGGALTKAGEFLGKQAEILNRRAATFDEISDILARTGAKLQGFFVGVLDGIADDLLPALQQLDQMDFAAMGQTFAVYLKAGVESVYQMYQVFTRITTLLGDVFGMLFSADFWGAASQMIWGAFATPLQKFANGLTAIFSGGTFKKLIAAFFSGADVTAEMGKILGDALSQTTGGEKQMQDAANKLSPFFTQISEDLSAAFEPLKGLDDLIPKDKTATPAPTPQIDGTTYGPPKPKAPQEDGTKFGPDRSMFKPEVFGPSKDLMSASGHIAVALRKRGDEEAAAGFKGLAERTEMQRQRILGGGPGESGVFASDRKRLGLVSGLQTGSLGEKRRLATSKDQQDAKKALSAQEAQLDRLSSIDTNLKQALTVS